MRRKWRYYPTVWVFGKGVGYITDGAVYFNHMGKVLGVRLYRFHPSLAMETLPFPEGMTIDEGKQLVEVTLRLVHPEWFNGQEAA